jgi:putative SOS response-associated peptidase YedK
MCGRFVLKSPFSDLAKLYRAIFETNAPARYNIAPTQDIATVAVGKDGTRKIVAMTWGLVPSWSKAFKAEFTTINAKSETLADSKIYAKPFQSRRCLIPADGFYEWKKLDAKTKQPYFFTLKSGPMAFAGLWESWRDREQENVRLSATIITTTANDVVAPIHTRMPAILDERSQDIWLTADTKQDALAELLRPYPAERMEAWPVDRAVGNVRNDGPHLILNSA